MGALFPQLGTEVIDGNVTILDVGHGSCVLLSSQSELVMVDTGAGTTVLEHLRAIGRSTVDRVVISHADSDHVGALHNLLANAAFTVREIWLNGDAFKGSQLWTSLNYELDEHVRAGATTVDLGVVQGRTFATGPFEVDILAPRIRLAGLGAGGRDRDGRRLESNSLSIVCRISVGSDPVVLLPGDLDETGLSHLLDQSPVPDMNAAVLIFPHHGGNVSRAASPTANVDFATTLTQLVMPRTVVFSVGRGVHGTPRPEIVSAIRSVVPDVNILCTELSQRCSAANVRVGNDSHLIDTVARGRSGGACCAGSIVLEHDGSSWDVRPAKSAHQAFISVNTATPLCRSTGI